MVATEVMVGASSAAANMAVTVDMADMEVMVGTVGMAVAMAVGGQTIMVAMEVARVRVPARVSPAVSGEGSAALAR
jgi:hypothetical protein